MDAPGKLFEVGKLAFPEDKRPPPQLLQILEMALVPLPVAEEFFLPKFPACIGHGGETATRMLMPKTPVNEDHLPAGGKHEVGLSGKVFPVEAVPVLAWDFK
jgi:hypothetical protein